MTALAAARRGIGADVGEEADLHDGGDIHAGAEEEDVAERVVAHLAAGDVPGDGEEDHQPERSEEHTSELQSLMRISYAVFCLKKKKKTKAKQTTENRNN